MIDYNVLENITWKPFATLKLQASDEKSFTKTEECEETEAWFPNFLYKKKLFFRLKAKS